MSAADPAVGEAATTGADHRIVFTDLDGTLLDHDTYEPGPAATALDRLRRAGVTVVFCSSKTRREQEAIRSELGAGVSLIVENGAAIHPFADPGEDLGRVVVLGSTYDEVRAGVAVAASRAGVAVRGYGDLSNQEVADLTGLGRAAAERARAREYTESLQILEEAPDAPRRLGTKLRELGFRLSRGSRFWLASGDHDKGTAVRRFLDDVRGRLGPVRSFGVGDFYNDLDMLAEVDSPFLVQRPDGSWVDIDLPRLVRVDGVGPEGWRRASEMILGE